MLRVLEDKCDLSFSIREVILQTRETLNFIFIKNS